MFKSQCALHRSDDGPDADDHVHEERLHAWRCIADFPAWSRTVQSRRPALTSKDRHSHLRAASGTRRSYEIAESDNQRNRAFRSDSGGGRDQRQQGTQQATKSDAGFPDLPGTWRLSLLRSHGSYVDDWLRTSRVFLLGASRPKGPFLDPVRDVCVGELLSGSVHSAEKATQVSRHYDKGCGHSLDRQTVFRQNIFRFSLGFPVDKQDHPNQDTR